MMSKTKFNYRRTSSKKDLDIFIKQHTYIIVSEKILIEWQIDTVVNNKVKHSNVFPFFKIYSRYFQ